MSTTATIDPTEAISAAVRELYDQLRALVDRGPTDDPTLLDQLAALTRPVRSKITRARKRAQTATPALSDQQPAVAESATAPRAARKPVSDDDRNSRPVPSSTPTVATPALSRMVVRLAEVPAAVSSQEIPAPAAVSATRRGRHRQNRARRPWQVRLLVIMLMVVGTAVSVATGHPLWGIGGAIIGIVALEVADRRRARRAQQRR
jgi:hypothetical protein